MSAARPLGRYGIDAPWVPWMWVGYSILYCVLTGMPITTWNTWPPFVARRTHPPEGPTMRTIRAALHIAAATSAALAAAICMAICQIIALAMGEHPADALLLGLSLSAIAFGGTYAGVFFIALVRPGRGEAVLPA